jgi:hypothetical protein
MDTKVVTALIAAFSSLVVALFAWATSRRTAKLQVEQQRAQAEYERKLKALSMAESEAAPTLAAANGLWRELQLLKHALDVLLVDGHPEIEDAIAAASAASTALSKSFATDGLQLPPSIRSAWHQSKNDGVDAMKIVNEYLGLARYERGFPDGEKARILAIRAKLTERQRSLEQELVKYKFDLQKSYADILRPDSLA